MLKKSGHCKGDCNKINRDCKYCLEYVEAEKNTFSFSVKKEEKIAVSPEHQKMLYQNFLIYCIFQKRYWKICIVIKKRCNVLRINWFMGKIRRLIESLSSTEKFLSKLKNEGISDRSYKHAKELGIHLSWKK